MTPAQLSRDWGIRLLAMAIKAREDGDVLTAELFTADAMHHLIQSDRLAAQEDG